MKRVSKGRSTELTIDAMPTKELFINMLTRDINLMEAISDLVDNCIDGARSIRGDRSFKELCAEITVNGDRFEISDNCGGISVETAKNYAFRFGRPPSVRSVKHSVGRFGVGMKRAIFKMGNIFEVRSNTKGSRFEMVEDIREWAKDTESWQFAFKTKPVVERVSKSDIGTSIVIRDLHNDVAEYFASDVWRKQLRGWLETRLQEALSNKFQVILNRQPLTFDPTEFLAHEKLLPAFKEFWIPKKAKNNVRVRLYCGLVMTTDIKVSGWHVFCNGRLILEGDKTAVTGWGEQGHGIRIPKFHGQYNNFLGYALFDCDDPDKLPWNTMKTGLDTESAVYGKAKQEMMTLMKPVKSFLDELKKQTENSPDGENHPLTVLLRRSVSLPYQEVQTRDVFEGPVLNEQPPGPKVQRISYERPLVQVKKVKRALHAKSFKEVGEKTFDYYFDSEVEQ